MSNDWYSERLTMTGRWCPQRTPDKPREGTNEGRRFTLRRVREIAPEEAHLSLGALRAKIDAQDAEEHERAQAQALGARDLVLTGVGE